MRVAWTVFSVVLLVNVLALVGFVYGLRLTGRLDDDRVERLVRTLKMTTEQEEQEQALAEGLEEQNRVRAAEMARLEVVRKGPVTFADQLRSTHLGEDATLHIENRTRRDIEDLQRQVELAKRLIAKQRVQLDAERKVFDEENRRLTQLKEDTDFRQAVRMYEQLKPKMAKQMFTRLLGQGKTQQVVNYLAAMKMRKAAGVLSEFKTPAEVALATGLVQQLRERGLEPTGPGELAANLPAGGAR